MEIKVTREIEPKPEPKTFEIHLQYVDKQGNPCEKKPIMTPPNSDSIKWMNIRKE